MFVEGRRRHNLDYCDGILYLLPTPTYTEQERQCTTLPMNVMFYSEYQESANSEFHASLYD